MTPERTRVRRARWILCEWCERGAQESLHRSGWCRVCAPMPEEALRTQAVVAQRVEQAVVRQVMAAPAGHWWISRRSWTCEHLFADDEETGYCGKAAIAGRPAEDPEARSWASRPCHLCQESFESQRRAWL